MWRLVLSCASAVAGCRYQHYILIVSAQLWLRNKFSLSFMGFTFTLFWIFTQSAANLWATASTRRWCWMTSASHPAPAKAAAFGSVLSMSGSVFSCYLWTDVNHPRQSFFFGSRDLKKFAMRQELVAILCSTHRQQPCSANISSSYHRHRPVRSVSVPRMLNHFRALFVHNLDASHSKESNFPRLPRKRSFPS